MNTYFLRPSNFGQKLLSMEGECSNIISTRVPPIVTPPFLCQHLLLTLNVPCISGSCVEIKIKLNFYFHTYLWCLKAFIKPFEGPQRSVKMKI